jgi:S-methylmethionine-dependent homocysteine/selenocysteine methylase
LNISFVIKESDVPKAVQRLHAQFFPAPAKAISAHTKNGSGKRARANGRGAATPRARAANASEVADGSADLIS